MSKIRANLGTTGVYHSYLLRFWQSNDKGDWHASVQCIQSSTTTLFGDLASLYLFLKSELGNEPPTGAPPSHPG